MSNAVVNAVASGLLTHPSDLSCAICQRRDGEPHPDGSFRPVRIIYHHHDYDAPLWVTPLCGPCHRKVHLGQLLEPATGQTTEHLIVPALWASKAARSPIA